ncbi:MAG: hypothetical protein HY532_03385 [Chloroflexi bacterium]|nr:hypothetical protein [Chloroflexota bacterium]
MLAIIPWLLALELLGLLALPILYVLLPRLPDRGFAFTKPIGLILVFYPLWLLASTPLVPNSRGTIIVIVLALGACSGWLAWRNRGPLLEFLKLECPLLLLAETVFLAVFLFWATVIAQDAAIAHTEQPMDFGFFNATLVSRHFPPGDMWLSGWKVSYYYFGYLIFGGVTQLVGIDPPIGYNLGLATVGGLAAMAAFGVVYNLVRLIGGRAGGAALAGLASVLLLLFVSNLVGGLELLRAGGQSDPGFWQWVDVKGLTGPQLSSSWYPSEAGWWWWRATRVIDTVQNGASLDYTITEFPFFSLHLGDLHPHVMSLPFVLAFLGLALAFFASSGGRAPSDRGRLGLLALMALLLGGLGFINLWDLPVFGVLLLAVAVVKGYALAGRGWLKRLASPAEAIAVILLAVVLYVPFFFSFNSQASGVAPVDLYVSRYFHFFLVWGLFLVLVTGYLLWQIGIVLRRWPRRRGVLLSAVAIALAPWLLWALVQGVRLWDLGDAVEDAVFRLWRLSPLVALLAAAGYLALRLAREAVLVPVATAQAGSSEATAEAGQSGSAPALASGGAEREEVVLPAGVEVPRGASDTGAVVPPLPSASQEKAGAAPSPIARAFPLVLIGMAVLLLMGPELFRVVDLFGNRMNTIFKLYYQAWALLALAGGFALYSAIEWAGKAKLLGRLYVFPWLGLVALGIVISLYYPAAVAYTKARLPSSQATLDGLVHVQRFAPAEYQAIHWLRGHARDGDVLVEAVGDDYSEYGRVSSSTGIPAVLGWTFHQQQWRGSRQPFEGRSEDVQRLYQTGDSAEAKAILDKYGVTYIYIGQRERAKYGGISLTTFAVLGDEVFRQGDVVIYRVRS